MSGKSPKVFNNILEAVGHTPIVRLNKLTKDLDCEIWVKLEFVNPGGSIKDRIAVYIIEQAEKQGKIKPGGTIVEATSGNTGMGLAMAAAVKGYQTIFVMPDKMTSEKIETLRAFGAKVIITPTAVEADDPRSYYSVAKRIAEETPNSFYVSQYHNPLNPEAHFLSTGPEIYEQTDGQFDYLICGMGTGGTISGSGKYLKSKMPNLKVVGVDPVGSMYYDKFKYGRDIEPKTYAIEGIGEDFYPSTMNMGILDDVVQVQDKEAMLMTRKLLTQEGIFAGISSGAAVAGAVKFAKNVDAGKKILVIIPDSGFRYLSKVYNDVWMRENGFLEYYQGNIKDLLDAIGRQNKRDIFTVRPEQTIQEAVELMQKYGISQIPVIREKQVLGVVGESDLITPLLSGKVSPKATVGDFAKDNFVTVSLGDSIDTLPPIFKANKLAMVMSKDRLVDVLTKIDMITYLTLNNAQDVGEAGGRNG